MNSAGGVFVAFVGVVLLIAAAKGSLKNVWHAVLTPDSSSSSAGGPSTGGSSVTPSASGAAVSPSTAQAQIATGRLLTPPPGVPGSGQPNE